MCFHRCSLPLLTVSSGSGNPGGHYKGHFLWLPKPEAPGCQVSEGFSALSTSPRGFERDSSFSFYPLFNFLGREPVRLAQGEI